MADDKQAALYAALAKAQGNFKPILKNRTVKIRMKAGGAYDFRYADIDEINLKTRPALTEQGLSVIQPVQTDRSTGAMWIETILTHADGGSITSAIDLKPAGTYADPKEFGAAVTYLRRYAVSSLLGVAADDDLDERPKSPFEDNDNAVLTTLQRTAQEAADQGLAFYADFFQKLTKQDRQALADHHKQLKARAEKVDASKTTEGVES